MPNARAAMLARVAEFEASLIRRFQEQSLHDPKQRRGGSREEIHMSDDELRAIDMIQKEFTAFRTALGEEARQQVSVAELARVLQTTPDVVLTNDPHGIAEDVLARITLRPTPGKTNVNGISNGLTLPASEPHCPYIRSSDEGTSYCALAASVPAPASGREDDRTPGCHAGKDGECSWSECPQLRDGEPERSGRFCPLPHWTDGDDY